MNKVELSGRIYNIKEATTSSGKTVTRFGLSIYTGKNKEGKSQYGFIDCKYFGRVSTSEELQDVSGRLTVDSWEKDGKKFSKPEVIVDEIKESEMFAKPVEKKKDEGVPFNDDNIDDIFN